MLPQLTALGVARASTLPPPNQVPWADCMKFFEKPWFSRAWPVQEIVLSGLKTVCCGAKLYASWEFLGFFAWVVRFNQRYRSACPQVYNHRPTKAVMSIYYYALTYNGKGFPLLTMLEVMSPFDSGDPRDKVFALLNMVDFELAESTVNVKSMDRSLLTRPPRLNPDYSDGNPVEDVNCETTIYLICRDRNLNVLGYLDDRESAEEIDHGGASSSWAPRWECQVEPPRPISDIPLVGSREEREDDLFSACGRFSSLKDGDSSPTQWVVDG